MPHCNKKMLSFFLTTKCNLCCRYCYNAHERSLVKERSLSLEIAKAGIDWYFNTNESRHIRFYGPGEPTQEFELMRSITDYARKHPNRGENVTVEIQTNGVFTEEVRNWILDNVNIVWLSFDGMPDIQNHNRPLNPKYKAVFSYRQSAEIIESNAKWLIQNTGNRNLMVGARATISDCTIDIQKQMIDYFCLLGIKYIWHDPLFMEVKSTPVFMDEKRKKKYHFDFERYVQKYVDAFVYAKEKGVFWGSFLAVNFDGESCYHCRCCTPLNAPHLTPDGYISSCDMVVLGAEPHHMSPFIVGQWDDANKKFVFDMEKVRQLEKRKSTNMLHCQNCPAQMYCGGYCLGETLNETGDIRGQSIEKCNAIVQLFEIIGTQPPYKYLHP